MTQVEPDHSPKIDMQVPETFHRLKRTLLILSAALVVLALSNQQPLTTIKLVIVDLTIEAWKAKLLLSLAAIYYAVGFGFEAASARRINLSALAGLAGSDIDSRLGKQALELADRAEGVLNSVHEAGAEATRAIAMVDNALESLAGLRDRGNASAEAWLEQTIQNDQSPIGVVARLERIRLLLGNLILPTGHTQGHVERLANQISELQTTFARLNPRITKARVYSFLWWEVGGAGAMFIAGIGFAWWREILATVEQLGGYLAGMPT